MKAGWTEVALGDVCVFRYGKALKAEARTGEGFDVYGSNGPVGKHSVSLTDRGTIVIGRKGSYGEVHYSPRPVWPIDTTYYVTESDTSCDLRWLSYRLRGLGLTGLNRAAAVPGLNRDDAYRQRFLLPPLDEQRRIAGILDTAASVASAARRKAVLADELRSAVFLDGVAAGEAWPTITLEELLDEDRGGIRTGPFGSQLLHGEFTDAGIPVLGIDNAVANEFRWGQRRFITDEKYRELKRYTVNQGDVLITIMGTCGRVAVVPDDIGVAINTKHLCCITLDQKRCLPGFLHAYFLSHPIAQKYLRSRAKGAIMDGLNMGIIKGLPVVVPPIEVQSDLVRQLADVDMSRRRVESLGLAVGSLQAALGQRAFAGEL